MRICFTSVTGEENMWHDRESNPRPSAILADAIYIDLAIRADTRTCNTSHKLHIKHFNGRIKSSARINMPLSLYILHRNCRKKTQMALKWFKLMNFNGMCNWILKNQHILVKIKVYSLYSNWVYSFAFEKVFEVEHLRHGRFILSAMPMNVWKSMTQRCNVEHLAVQQLWRKKKVKYVRLSSFFRDVSSLLMSHFFMKSCLPYLGQHLTIFTSWNYHGAFQVGLNLWHLLSGKRSFSLYPKSRSDAGCPVVSPYLCIQNMIRITEWQYKHIVRNINIDDLKIIIKKA